MRVSWRQSVNRICPLSAPPVFSAAAEENGMLVFSVDFAVLPGIDTGSYGDIRITRPAGKVSERDIDHAIHAQQGNIDNDDIKLRTAIRERLEYRFARAVRQAIRPQLMEALLTRHSFTPPEAMVAREFEKRMAGWRQRKAANPMLKIPEEERVRANSRRAVCLGMIFTAIIQSAKILRDDERIRQEIEYIASRENNPDEVIDRYHHDEAMLAQVEEAVRIDKAIDWVVSKADVVDVPTSFAQIVKGAG